MNELQTLAQAEVQLGILEDTFDRIDTNVSQVNNLADELHKGIMLLTEVCYANPELFNIE